MRRVEPSRNMTYQSGWLAAETTAASYGPNSQIGLIWNRPASSAITPKTIMKKPPALAAKPREHAHADHVVVGPAGAGPLGVLLLDHQAHVDA